MRDLSTLEASVLAVSCALALAAPWLTRAFVSGTKPGSQPFPTPRARIAEWTWAATPLVLLVALLVAVFERTHG